MESTRKVFAVFAFCMMFAVIMPFSECSAINTESADTALYIFSGNGFNGSATFASGDLAAYSLETGGSTYNLSDAAYTNSFHSVDAESGSAYFGITAKYTDPGSKTWLVIKYYYSGLVCVTTRMFSEGKVNYGLHTGSGSPVPIPGTALLLATGLLGLFGIRRVLA